MLARLAILLVIPTASMIAAQAPATAPAFEVSSVKRNVSGRIEGSIQVPPTGTIRYTNVMLRMLIRDAYQVDGYTEKYRLVAGPYARLIGTADGRPDATVPRFDVQGKPPANTTGPERRAMMRTLLEDRFKLRVHHELRQVPAYALTVARPGRLGPNVAASKFDCDAYLTRRRAGAVEQEPVDARGNSWCLFPIDHRRPGVENIRDAGSVKRLMQRLQGYVDRPIVDATGLSGNIEWILTFAWTPTAPTGGLDPPADAPDLLTALQDQLGLKLETRQAPIDVLVVDSVELPTPD